MLSRDWTKARVRRPAASCGPDYVYFISEAARDRFSELIMEAQGDRFYTALAAECGVCNELLRRLVNRERMGLKAESYEKIWWRVAA